MVQIGEKDQGCKMINGVELQYPDANQSVIQKAKYESKNLNATNKTHKSLLNRTLKNTKLKNFFKICKNLNLNFNFIVAVSGGPDSLALCFLSKIYSIKIWYKTKIFIVDHKLEIILQKRPNL